MAQRSIPLLAAAAAWALALGFALPATAKGGFGSPVLLSQNGHAASVSVAMDGAGNALAAWADEGMFYSTRPAGGSWSAPQAVYVGGGFPVMRAAADGSATIVSYTNLYGIWSVDRLPGGAWTSPYLIVNAPQVVASAITNVSSVQFLDNVRGDQAIVFEQLVGGNTVLTTVRRPAGGAWGAPSDAVSSAVYGDIALASAALGDNGDLVVTFETYAVSCTKYCHELNFAVHASRQAFGTGTWSDSGALTAPSSPYFARTVVDAAGQAALFIQNGFSATIQATTQARAGAAWRPLVNATTGTGQDGAMMWDAKAGQQGLASLAYVYLGNPAGAITVLDGSAAKNTWPTSNVLSGADNPGPNDNLVFDENEAGGAVAEWSDTDGTVRAALRTKAKAAWGAAQTIVGGAQCNVGGALCTGAVAASVNGAGQAVIAYIRFDSSFTYSWLYVATQ